MHYCGGELETVSYLIKSTSCCGADEEDESDCCKNETHVVKNDSQFSFSNDKINFNPELFLLSFLNFNSESIFELKNSSITITSKFLSNKPPNTQAKQTIANTVLII